MIPQKADYLSHIREAFQENFIAYFGAEFTTKVLQWGKGSVDATWSRDRWDYGRDTHYTHEGGGEITYRFPKEILCSTRVILDDLPPDSPNPQFLQNAVKAAINLHKVNAFQTSIDGGDDPAEFLANNVDALGGQVSGLRWIVRDVDVQEVRAQVRGTEAVIDIIVRLDIDVDDSAASGEADSDRQATDRRIRSALIRVAHLHPETRADILPLLRDT